MAKSKIKNWAINTDKLKVCFNITNEIYTYFAEHSTKIERKNDNSQLRFLEEDDFFLVFFDEEETKMSATLNIRQKDGSGENFKLGTFTFHKGKKYENKAFFLFENSALYRIFSKDYYGETHGYIYCLMYVAEHYGMKFNNITELELAFDSDFNFVKKIRQMIKNVNKYDLFLNGKKVDDNEEILNGYGEYYSRNRMKLQLPTLYFSQAKASDMRMRVYDKTTELKESTPHKEKNFKKWLNWEDETNIYRVEIVFHNTNVRDFFDRYDERMAEMGGHDNVISLLDMSDIRMMMFLDASDRLIYFKDKKTQEKISLLEISGI